MTGGSEAPARYSRDLGDDTFAVFLLHGVIRRPAAGGVRNSIGKHLLLERFEEVLDDLLACGTPVTVDDACSGRPLPPRAFAITFDDGFANNLEVAAPALRARRVPAVFYLTTDFVDEGRSSWIDEIEAALAAAGRFALDLPFGRREGVGDAAILDLLDEVRRVVKSDRAIDPYDFAGDLVGQLGMRIGEATRDPELDGKLTWEQARELAADPLFTVGGHGMTHRILEHLDDAALRAEIDGSLDLLQARLGRTLRHYSYPEGLAHCYSDRVIALLRARGIVCAPSAEHGVNRAGDDPFRLRRITVV